MHSKSLLFENCVFVLDSSISFKSKKLLQKAIIQHGGTISYILNKAVSFVIVANDHQEDIESYRIRKARELKIPVLKQTFIIDSISKNCILDFDQYMCGNLERNDKFKKGKIEVIAWQNDQSKYTKKASAAKRKVSLCRYVSGNRDCPEFGDDYKVVKFVILQGEKEVQNVGIEKYIYSVELHISLSNDVDQYRVLEQGCVIASDQDINTEKKLSFECFFKSCNDALLGMQQIVNQILSQPIMSVINYLPQCNVGSFKLRRMLDEMGAAAGNLHPSVAKLVTGIMTLALGEVMNNIENVNLLTADQIIKASVILMKIKEAIQNNKSTSGLSRDLSRALSFKTQCSDISNMKLLSQQLDFLQLLKDTLLLTENTTELQSVVGGHSNSSHQIASFYKMLKCSINVVEKDDVDYRSVLDVLTGSDSDSLPGNFTVRNVFTVHRDIEDAQFKHSVLPSKLLLHASDSKNFVGILSRGLLLPLVVVSEHGGTRSDVGMLGNAIYFTDNLSKAVAYSKANPISGSRLLLITEVALGKCQDYAKHSPSLTKPPEGFNSVRGVGKNEDIDSDFEFNEYAIFNVEQQRIRYLVEFTLEEDAFIEDLHFASPDKCIITNEEALEKVSLNDVENVENPIKSEKLGLLPSKDSDSGFQVSLEEVHIRAKLVDMAAEVVIMQAYANHSQQAVEAKYVFPLDDSAAVCGFEAFINNKHVIGKVKEKEQAHKEYRAAIEAGHGAYLMDQEKADVFTVNVGNLPAGAKVLIKITYVCELTVVAAEDGSSDSIIFHIPGHITPPVKHETLLTGPITQTKVDTVTTDAAKLNRSSLFASVEMPYDIRQITSSTHKIHVKRTATKACVRMAKNEEMGNDGFKLAVTMAEIHVPRMWVEELPDDSNDCACMLAFYPEFEADPVLNYKAVIMMDMSQSMKTSDNIELDAKKLALMILKNLPPTCQVNVIKFGSAYQELFVREHLLEDNGTKIKAQDFIQSCTASYGASEAWRPLDSLDAIQSCSNLDQITNVFFISDGHLSEENRLLQICHSLGENTKRNSVKLTRIFSFGVGSSANRHILSSMSHASGGAHEHFSRDSKSKWEQKVFNQLDKAKQPVLKDIKINWERHETIEDVTEDDLSFPNQAPEKIKTFFNCSRLVAYGFIPHCTSAQLHAKIGNQEINTVISTSQLSIKQGAILHRLAARAFIKDYEDGMYEVDPLKRDELKAFRKPYIIKLSCKHDVISPYTSFVAVEEREKGESSVSKDAPAIADLVKMMDVDVIPEILWDQCVLEEEMPDMERLTKMIDSAETASFSSVLESQRLFEEIDKFVANLSGDDRGEASLKVAETKVKLHVDVKLPNLDEKFMEYLMKMCSDYDKFISFLDLISSSEKSQWNLCPRDNQPTSVLLDKTFFKRQLDFEISDSDRRWQCFLDWWAYVCPEIFEQRRKAAYREVKIQQYLCSSSTDAGARKKTIVGRTRKTRKQNLERQSFSVKSKRIPQPLLKSREAGDDTAMEVPSASLKYTPTSPHFAGIPQSAVYNVTQKRRSKVVRRQTGHRKKMESRKQGSGDDTPMEVPSASPKYTPHFAGIPQSAVYNDETMDTTSPAMEVNRERRLSEAGVGTAVDSTDQNPFSLDEILAAVAPENERIDANMPRKFRRKLRNNSSVFASPSFLNSTSAFAPQIFLQSGRSAPPQSSLYGATIAQEKGVAPVPPPSYQAFGFSSSHKPQRLDAGPPPPPDGVQFQTLAAGAPQPPPPPPSRYAMFSSSTGVAPVPPPPGGAPLQTVAFGAPPPPPLPPRETLQGQGVAPVPPPSYQAFGFSSSHKPQRLDAGPPPPPGGVQFQTLAVGAPPPPPPPPSRYAMFSSSTGVALVPPSPGGAPLQTVAFGAPPPLPPREALQGQGVAPVPSPEGQTFGTFYKRLDAEPPPPPGGAPLQTPAFGALPLPPPPEALQEQQMSLRRSGIRYARKHPLRKHEVYEKDKSEEDDLYLPLNAGADFTVSGGGTELAPAQILSKKKKRVSGATTWGMSPNSVNTSVTDNHPEDLSDSVVMEFDNSSRGRTKKLDESLHNLKSMAVSHGFDDQDILDDMGVYNTYEECDGASFSPPVLQMALHGRREPDEGGALLDYDLHVSTASSGSDDGLEDSTTSSESDESLEGFAKFKDFFPKVFEMTGEIDSNGEMENALHDVENMLNGKNPEDFKVSEDIEDLTHLDEILKSAGAMSLGEKMYKAAGVMLMIALAIGFLEEALKYKSSREVKKLLAMLEKWLKEKDEKIPSLYLRLELGSSWSEAAVKVVNQLFKAYQMKDCVEEQMLKMIVAKILSYSTVFANL